MKKTLVFAAFAFSFSGSTFAQNDQFRNVFQAPAVSSTGAWVNKEQGDIIFVPSSSTAGSFYGYSGSTGSWQNFSAASVPADPSTDGIVTYGSQTFGGDKVFNDDLNVNGALTPAGGIVGRSDGVAVPQYMVGEKVETKVTTATNFPTSNQYGDLGNVSLTPGVWLITYILSASLNGSTTSQVYAGISTTAGNSGSGLVTGDNQFGSLPPTSVVEVSVPIPSYYVNIPSNTTYYAKVLAAYSAGTPKFTGRITAVRIN